MAKGDYEILPRDELDNLKKEIEKLKKGEEVSGSEDSSPNASAGIEKLNNSINSLIELFKTAQDSMENDDKETSEQLTKKIDPLNEKIDQLIDQNKKIAQGILTVADLVKSVKQSLETPQQNNQQGFQQQSNQSYGNQMSGFQRGYNTFSQGTSPNAQSGMNGNSAPSFPQQTNQRGNTSSFPQQPPTMNNTSGSSMPQQANQSGMGSASGYSQESSSNSSQSFQQPPTGNNTQQSPPFSSAQQNANQPTKPSAPGSMPPPPPPPKKKGLFGK